MTKAPDTRYLLYQHDSLNSVIKKSANLTVFRAGTAALAEIKGTETWLLATDGNNTILSAKAVQNDQTHIYTAYGQLPPFFYSSVLLAFNGEPVDVALKSYLLGNGYRIFTSTRFYSADTLSPFGKGGINAYAYCGGDPINNTDPSGHATIRRAPTHAHTSMPRISRRPNTPPPAYDGVVASPITATPSITRRGEPPPTYAQATAPVALPTYNESFLQNISPDAQTRHYHALHIEDLRKETFRLAKEYNWHIRAINLSLRPSQLKEHSKEQAGKLHQSIQALKTQLIPLEQHLQAVRRPGPWSRD